MRQGGYLPSWRAPRLRRAAIDTLAAFTEAVERLTGGFAAGSDRLGLAVSGGPDSLALLLLGQQAYPGRISAATVDHGLRDESTAEAAMVAQICADRGILHATLYPSDPLRREPGRNLSDAAREARYALLESWRETDGLAWIATAHHADDQLETLLMRLARGSGLDGLAGVRARYGRVIRPLLAVRRKALADICDAAGITPVDDPTNRDDAYDRARLRKALADVDFPLDPLAAARSAGALAQSAEALDWMVARLAQERTDLQPGGLHLDPTDLPREVLRRLVIHLFRPRVARGHSVEQLLDRLELGEPGMLGDLIFRPKYGVWVISHAPPRKSG